MGGRKGREDLDLKSEGWGEGDLSSPARLTLFSGDGQEG